MAQIKNTSLSGKIGNVVASNWKGVNYLKAAPRRTAPPTEGEKANRYIFKLVQDWIQPLNPFVKVGFRGFSPRSYGRNAAISLLHKEALQRDGFDSFIDPALVRVSSGSLGLAQQLEVHLEENEQLVFTWDTGIGRKSSPRDRVMLLAYNIEKETAIYELYGARRFEGTDRLSLASAPAGVYHVYAAFVAEDGSGQSDSGYGGSYEL